jgi:hypothetical protein
MRCFYKLKINNLESIQAHALSKISEEDLNLMPTRLFYPEYNFLDDQDLLCALNQYGLTNYIHNVALFVLNSGGISPIHVDGDNDYNWSLNIPLKNCRYTRTNFYQSNEVPVKKKSPNSDIEYSIFDPNSCTLLDSLRLSDPFLMNVSVPHSISNLTFTTRVSICIRIKSTFDIEAALSEWDLK